MSSFLQVCSTSGGKEGTFLFLLLFIQENCVFNFFSLILCFPVILSWVVFRIPLVTRLFCPLKRVISLNLGSLAELYLKLWSYSFPLEWQKKITKGENMIIFLIYVESFGSTENIFPTQCIFGQVGTLFGRRGNHIDWSELLASKNRSPGRSSGLASIPAPILGEIKWTISLNGFSKTLHVWKDFHLIMPFLYISYLSVNATDINHTWMRGKTFLEIPIRAG